MNGKTIGKIVLLASFCLGIGQTTLAVTVTVAAGEDHALTAAENVDYNVVLLNNGSTLTIPSTLGANVAVKAYIKIAENAAATLNVEAGVSSLRLNGGLYALAGGALAVTGIGTVSIGKVASASAINTTPLDIATLTFTESGATGLVLADSVTVRNAPTTCPLSISSGANVALLGTDVLAPFGITGDITLSDFDLVILSQAAIATNRTITVMPGRTLAIKPCQQLEDWQWAGIAPGSYETQNIVLGGEGARCVFRNGTNVQYTNCPVSGTGEVIFKPDSTSQNATMLYGPFEYDGVFAIDNGSYVQTYTYAWGSGSRSLRLANGATYRPNGIVSFSSLSLGGSATLELLFNSNLTIGDVVSGASLALFAASGAAGGHAEFTGSFPRPFTLTAEGPAYCTFGGGRPLGGMTCPVENGITYLWPDASGVIDCSGLSLGGGQSHATLYADGVVLTNVSASLTVSATGTVVVAASSPGASVRAEAGGSVTYATATADWQSGVFLWIDPSTAEFIPVFGQDSNKARVDGNVLFANIRDVRPNQTTYSLWNRRDQTTTKSSINWQVYPLAVQDGCNGLTIISLGGYEKNEAVTYVFDDGTDPLTKSAQSARRILLAKNDITANGTGPQQVGAVTMVFGSQNGGGAAIVGTLNGAFCRTGTTLSAGITTNTAHRIFVNGELVADPPSQKLSGGWDVITVEMDGETLSAFGWGGSDGANNDWSHCGGQNYGEIIVFSAVPSDGQRVAAELYLAKKWGLAAKYTRKNDMVLSGSGTVRTDGCDANVSGRFSGTIDMAGGTLMLASRGNVPDETAVPTAALAGWFDPDDAGNILLNKDSGYSDAAANSNRVWAIYDKSRPARNDGDAFLFAVKARRPIIKREAHGDGPVRNWMHFDLEKNLRFLRLPLPPLDLVATNAIPLEGVREIFVVQDSSRGGGTPIVDKIHLDVSTITGMKILPRRTVNADTPIWTSRNNTWFTHASITGGVTRLNGTTVNGARTGFTGRDEVFSFSTTEPYAPAALADIWNWQATSNGVAYEVIGETLFFSQVLSDVDRKNVIDYLNAKWRGVLPEGSGDFTGATVTGSGSVVGESLAYMPRPSATFSGSFVVSANADCEFSVSPSAGTVSGAIVAPGTTFAFPASATATVNVVGKVPSGHWSFDLIDCAGFANETEWTPNLVGADDRNVSARLVTRAGKLTLELNGPGTILILR